MIDLDDSFIVDIQRFYRLINNKKIRVNDKVIFRIIDKLREKK